MSFYFIEIDQKLNWSLNSNLKANFQAGVDSIYDAVVAKGSTPASKSLSDVIAAINNIKTKGNYGATRILEYPGYQSRNFMTADKDYIAVIFMISSALSASNAGAWVYQCSCNGGSEGDWIVFDHAGTEAAGGHSYIGIKVYIDVPKGSSISNYMATTYGVYEL